MARALFVTVNTSLFTIVGHDATAAHQFTVKARPFCRHIVMIVSSVGRLGPLGWHQNHIHNSANCIFKSPSG
jgi:hypothetical protein